MIVAAYSALTWAKAMRFPNPTLKLLEEAKEVHAKPSLEEAADVFICLMAVCADHGWNLADLTRAVDDKMAVNLRRTWELAPNGTMHHVEEKSSRNY